MVLSSAPRLLLLLLTSHRIAWFPHRRRPTRLRNAALGFLQCANLLSRLLPPLPTPLPAATRNVALATSKQHVRQTSLESSLPLYPRLPHVASCHRERCWSPPRATRVWTTVRTRRRQPLQLVRVPFSMLPFLPSSSLARSGQQFAAPAWARCPPITSAPPRSLHAVLMSWHCCCHLSSIPANTLVHVQSCYPR